MADLSHFVGSDLSLGTGGSLATVDQAAATQQRVLRRLLTSKGSYIWQLKYGAGLPTLVGQVASTQQVAAIIKTQMAMETGVAQSPEPTVVVSIGVLGDVSAVINYTDSNTGTTETVSLTTGA